MDTGEAGRIAWLWATALAGLVDRDHKATGGTSVQTYLLEMISLPKSVSNGEFRVEQRHRRWRPGLEPGLPAYAPVLLVLHGEGRWRNCTPRSKPGLNSGPEAIGLVSTKWFAASFPSCGD